MSQMLKSSGAMAGATLISRLLGMVREMVYAAFMGDGPVASAFHAAFQIPNIFRRLLGEGALSAAFLPIFKEKEKTVGEKEVWQAANAVISGLVVATAIVVGLGIILITLLLQFQRMEENTRLMLQLLRLMFPYLLLVCVAAVCMGMLNARGHFFIPAMGGASLNVMMIASVFWLAPRMGDQLNEQIFALPIGILAAGVAQALFQMPTLKKEGFTFQWINPWGDPTVRLVVEKMIPGLIGVAAFQINVISTTALAFFVDDHIVASFNYAVRLMELPQGLFGVSLATYLLPTLSALAVDKKFPAFRSTLNEGLGYLVLVNLLAMVLLTVLAEPIIRLLFQRGNFDPGATERAAQALRFLAPGLLGFSIASILARAFYSLGDTTTPMRISAVCLMLNIVFAFFFIWNFRQAGLGLANSLSSTLNAALLLFALRKKLGRLELAGLIKETRFLIAGAVLAGFVAWFISSTWERNPMGRDLTFKILAVFLPAVSAALVYFAVARLFKVTSLGKIMKQTK